MLRIEAGQADGSKKSVEVECPGYWTKQALEIPGWFHPLEAAMVVKAMADLGPTGRYAEVGTFCGRSAALVADAWPSWTIYTQDSYPAGYLSQYREQDELLKVANPEEVAELVLSQRPNVRRMHRESHKPPNGVSDFRVVLIDAGHTKADVLMDARAWMPHAAHMCLMFFHDAKDPRFAADVQAGSTEALEPHGWKRHTEYEFGTLWCWGNF